MNKILVIGLDNFIQKFKSEYEYHTKVNDISFLIIEENTFIKDLDFNSELYDQMIYMNDNFTKEDYKLLNDLSRKIKISYYFNIESINLNYKNNFLWGIPHYSNHKAIKSSYFQLIAERLIAFLALIVLSPIFLLVSILIYVTDGLPIFFTQDRIGIHKKTFKIYKFRTLKNSTPKYMKSSEKTDNYYTKIGLFLRKSNIDELPQLLNILNGKMSIVGPRPEMPFIVNKYNYFEKFRLQVNPGISGLWQISNARQKEIHFNLEHDFYYLKKKSIFLDIKIIFLTLFKFLNK